MRRPKVIGMTRSERLQQAWLAQKEAEAAIDQFVRLLDGRIFSAELRAKWRDVQLKVSSFKEWLHMADFYGPS